MDKLNTLLIGMVAVAITAPFIIPEPAQAIQPVQMNVDPAREVSQQVYRSIYTISMSCDIAAEVRVALNNDNKITYSEATSIGDMCELQALKNADQPFERSMLKQEIKYIRTGGVSM